MELDSYNHVLNHLNIAIRSYYDAGINFFDITSSITISNKWYLRIDLEFSDFFATYFK